MTNYKPRHVSKDGIEALEEKIRQMEEKKRIEEKRRIQEEETRRKNESETETIPLSDCGEETEEERSKMLLYLLLGLAVFAMILFAGLRISAAGTAVKNLVDEEPAEEISPRAMDPSLRSAWISNKAVNEDYVGQIVFDSGLIDLPFVQAKGTIKEDGEPYRFFTADGQIVEDPYAYNGNDVYIWTSWKTGEYDRYGEGGSVFMDYRNCLDDQNIILYGHHFARDWDPSGKRQFTPLDVLLSEENYGDNRSLRLILDNEIRSYVVASIFTVDTEDDYESQIVRTDMNEDLSGNPDPGFFEEFIEYMGWISGYDTGEALSDGDRILTLITCIEHQPQYRQVVVCKETGRELFDG